MITEDKIHLTDEEFAVMNAEAERVMKYINSNPFYDHSNPASQKRGFMCELVARKFLRVPLELGIGEEELHRGYDIELYNDKGAKVFIDVKSGEIKDSWTVYTKTWHDLKIHRFKTNVPKDFVYIFISSTKDPKVFQLEGACTQKNLLVSLKDQEQWMEQNFTRDTNIPSLIKKGEIYYNRLQDNDTVVVPNRWLPYKGAFGIYNCINHLL